MKILVVEDDVMLADFLEDALLDMGHVVCAIVGSVEAAVHAVREHRPEVAVVDMQLQGQGYGTDIADLLFKTHDLKNLGILYISGESERVHRQAHFGHACLNKPYSIDALTAALTLVHDLANGGPHRLTIPRGIELIAGRPF